MDEVVIEFLRSEGILDDEGSVRCFVDANMLARLLTKFGDQMYIDGLHASDEEGEEE